MKTSDVVKFYGTKSQIARALEVSRQAVSEWGDVVPESSAWKLEALSAGALRVDRKMYRKKR